MSLPGENSESPAFVRSWKLWCHAREPEDQYYKCIMTIIVCFCSNPLLPSTVFLDAVETNFTHPRYPVSYCALVPGEKASYLPRPRRKSIAEGVMVSGCRWDAASDELVPFNHRRSNKYLVQLMSISMAGSSCCCFHYVETGTHAVVRLSLCFCTQK